MIKKHIMDIDNENMTISDDSDDELETESNGPWQCGLTNLQERAMALFRCRSFTDITLTFPETDITYDVHRIILAMSSPVFEGILYGPMRTEGKNIELHDEPSAIEYVLAYCYGYDLDLPDMETSLEVFKLADKYILDDLKNHCCKSIVSNMSKDNVKDVIEFGGKFNFTEFLKHNCIPYFKEAFEELQEEYEESKSYEDEPDCTDLSSILMDLNDDWIEKLLPEISIKFLEFPESWENPESPLGPRLNTIITSSGCNLTQFYGCVKAEDVHKFPVDDDPDCYFMQYQDPAVELCLSVTDPYHANKVIFALNQKKSFRCNLIAIHLQCKGIWPDNWSNIPKGRSYRPSMLLISDADDDKVAWVVEAAKALLPQREGNYTKVFRYDGRFDDLGERRNEKLKPINILKLPRSKFTLNGLLSLMQALATSGAKLQKIILQSPHITSEQQFIFQQNQLIQFLPVDHNFFIKVFEDFPTIVN